MNTISHLVFTEAPAICDIEAGKFLYNDAAGNETEAVFFVRTCADDDNVARRVDDYNEQYCDMYMQLQTEGATRIRYEDKLPSNIF